MSGVLVLLEDDPRRTEALLHLAETVLRLPVVHYDNAPDLLAWLEGNWQSALLFALDHDLGPSRIREGERFEPGIGREIADFLAERSPVCPVLIHSSNSPAAVGMQFCLEAAGWTVTRVFPFDDLEWIPRDWLPEALRLIDDFRVRARGGLHDHSLR